MCFLADCVPTFFLALLDRFCHSRREGKRTRPKSFLLAFGDSTQPRDNVRHSLGPQKRGLLVPSVRDRHRIFNLCGAISPFCGNSSLPGSSSRGCSSSRFAFQPAIPRDRVNVEKQTSHGAPSPAPLRLLVGTEIPSVASNRAGQDLSANLDRFAIHWHRFAGQLSAVAGNAAGRATAPLGICDLTSVGVGAG